MSDTNNQRAADTPAYAMSPAQMKESQHYNSPRAGQAIPGPQERTGPAAVIASVNELEHLQFALYNSAVQGLVNTHGDTPLPTFETFDPEASIGRRLGALVRNTALILSITERLRISL